MVVVKGGGLTVHKASPALGMCAHTCKCVMECAQGLVCRCVRISQKTTQVVSA